MVLRFYFGFIVSHFFLLSSAYHTFFLLTPLAGRRFVKERQMQQQSEIIKESNRIRNWVITNFIQNENYFQLKVYWTIWICTRKSLSLHLGVSRSAKNEKKPINDVPNISKEKKKITKRRCVKWDRHTEQFQLATTSLICIPQFDSDYTRRIRALQLPLPLLLLCSFLLFFFISLVRLGLFIFFPCFHVCVLKVRCSLRVHHHRRRRHRLLRRALLPLLVNVYIMPVICICCEQCGVFVAVLVCIYARCKPMSAWVVVFILLLTWIMKISFEF